MSNANDKAEILKNDEIDKIKSLINDAFGIADVSPGDIHALYNLTQKERAQMLTELQRFQPLFLKEA